MITFTLEKMDRVTIENFNKKIFDYYFNLLKTIYNTNVERLVKSCESEEGQIIRSDEIRNILGCLQRMKKAVVVEDNVEYKANSDSETEQQIVNTAE